MTIQDQFWGTLKILDNELIDRTWNGMSMVSPTWKSESHSQGTTDQCTFGWSLNLFNPPPFVCLFAPLHSCGRQNPSNLNHSASQLTPSDEGETSPAKHWRSSRGESNSRFSVQPLTCPWALVCVVWNQYNSSIVKKNYKLPDDPLSTRGERCSRCSSSLQPERRGSPRD